MYVRSVNICELMLDDVDKSCVSVSLAWAAYGGAYVLVVWTCKRVCVLAVRARARMNAADTP